MYRRRPPCLPRRALQWRPEQSERVARRDAHKRLRAMGGPPSTAPITTNQAEAGRNICVPRAAKDVYCPRNCPNCRMRMRKITSFIILVFLVVSVSGSYLAGSVLCAPALRAVGAPPPDLKAMDVEFEGIKGWFVPAEEGAPCVLLMHGVRSDRRSMIERARLLRRAGYSSLLFDFQAHGESPGQHITFGHLESVDARAAVLLLRTRFRCARVAAIGQSLGGAAALLGDGPILVDALVLESVYPTIDEAIADRLKIRFGRLGPLLAPLLTMQLEPRLSVAPRDLQPISRIGSFRHPVLVMAGTEDQHTPIAEARRLFRAANEPKEFWAVPGAGHVDLQRYAPEAYRRRLLRFLAQHYRDR